MHWFFLSYTFTQVFYLKNIILIWNNINIIIFNIIIFILMFINSNKSATKIIQQLMFYSFVLVSFTVCCDRTHYGRLPLETLSRPQLCSIWIVLMSTKNEVKNMANDSQRPPEVFDIFTKSKSIVVNPENWHVCE